jgi:alpha-ketoglutarate-dependent taurine dioxygenase
MWDVKTEPRVWDSSLPRPDVEYRISAAACDEFLRRVQATASDAAIGSLELATDPCPALARDIERCRAQFEHDTRVVIIQPIEGLDARGRRLFAWVVANLFGEPLVQNAQGDRVIAVYARPDNRRVIDGARYHQSREGGGPHTDNVSIPEPFEYLVFSCIRPAAVGGETILIDAFAIHRALTAVPEALRILEGPFWWEYRGINDGLFQAPIVTYDADGRPHFRYLRKYLESAHRRAGEPLSDEAVWALDTLEALADRTDLQWRTYLNRGEILVTVDSQVLHARTAFADLAPGGPADAHEAATNEAWRFFDRVWARRRP